MRDRNLLIDYDTEKLKKAVHKVMHIGVFLVIFLFRCVGETKATRGR